MIMISMMMMMMAMVMVMAVMVVMMVMVIKTSKPLPGLSTVRSPPLPFVTYNLAILHCPTRLHLKMITQ